MKLHYRLNETNILSKNISKYLHKTLFCRLLLPLVFLMIALSEYYSARFDAYAVHLAGPTHNTYRTLPDIIAYHPVLDLRLAITMVIVVMLTYYMKSKKLELFQTPGNYSLELSKGHIKYSHQEAELEFSCEKIKRIIIKNDCMILVMNFNLMTVLPLVIPLNAFRNHRDREDFIDEIKKSIPTIVVMEQQTA